VRLRDDWEGLGIGGINVEGELVWSSPVASLRLEVSFVLATTEWGRLGNDGRGHGRGGLLREWSRVVDRRCWAVGRC